MCLLYKYDLALTMVKYNLYHGFVRPLPGLRDYFSYCGVVSMGVGGGLLLLVLGGDRTYNGFRYSLIGN